MKTSSNATSCMAATASRSDYRIGDSAICQRLRDTDRTVSVMSSRLNNVGSLFIFRTIYVQANNTALVSLARR
jgi:hypothetical protein